MTENSAPFAGKIAVVTGGAQGLGEATARLLAARGAAGILITDRQVEKGLHLGNLGVGEVRQPLQWSGDHLG